MPDLITLKKSSGGVLLKNASGVLVKECDDGGCQFCTGDTPETLEVVFSDIEGCCVPGLTGLRTAILTSSAAWELNYGGTRTLTQFSEDSCLWWELILNVGYDKYFEVFECTTHDSHETTAQIVINLTKTSDSAWTLTARLNTTEFSSNYSGYLFYSTITEQAAGCTGNLSFTNDLTVCSGLAHGNAGYDGSATVSLP